MMAFPQLTGPFFTALSPDAYMKDLNGVNELQRRKSLFIAR
jgi:hypothetical protein